MKAINFPQVTNNVAENQDEYNTLPMWVGEEVYTDDGDKAISMVTCFSIDEEELRRINKYRKIWFRGLTFGRPLQPFNIFALDDYFDASSWNEDLSKVENLYEDTQKIKIKMPFMQRLFLLFRGHEYIHIRGRVKLPVPLWNVELNLKQDGKEKIQS